MQKMFVSLFLCAVFICTAATLAEAQFDKFRLIAVSDFQWNGAFWKDELPVWLADSMVSVLRRESSYNIWSRKETTNLLKAEGRENAFDCPPELIRTIFFPKRVNYVIAGRLNSLIQTRDVDSSVQIRLSIDIQFFDVKTPFLITTDRIEYNVKLDKEIPEGAAFDKGLANQIFHSVTVRMLQSARRVLGAAESEDF